MKKIAGLIFGSLVPKELVIEKRPSRAHVPCKHFNRRMDQSSDPHRKYLSPENEPR